ncbi:prenyltransferase [Candidatus Thiothrix anitrata]|uniref:Prenyltransferase n=1 Tax=Candidatus Thiothrix anitrata TaxID=2823902 RepID=A0ABX7X3U7_9GAMM|nr:prenyltransferase [Candidatus Thiothrix anitrata]QTR50540.1 prenyltransferase [Candidatus Thiothrix anitrata]
MTQEPDERLRQQPLLRYWLAIRPGFLAASIVPALVGAIAAWSQQQVLNGGLLALTLLAVILVHAGMNVLNDYYDEQNGTDRRNTQRLFPFTGGSRFIQNGVLSAGETLVFGACLSAAAMLVGVGLAWHSGMELLWIGAVGLLIGWGYSAPPLRLNSRGLGEPMIALSFGILTPLGAWFVQTGSLAWYPLLSSLPLSLLLMNILLINQFPDCEADAASGKHHWVVRFGVETAAKIYLSTVLLATLLLVSWVMLDVLPPMALLSALPLGISLRAGLQLMEHAHAPHKLEPAIKMTIGSAVLHGMLLSLALGLSGFG